MSSFAMMLFIISALNTLSRFSRCSPCPLDKKLFDFVKTVEKVLVLEETDQVIEAMLGDREKVLGRASGHVPGAGEITYCIL